MQEHFNENYLESDKYPKASFSGSFKVSDELKAMEDGSYDLMVSGELTIHGVTKPLETAAILTADGGILSGNVVFKVNLKEHDIKIPKVVVKNIAEEVEVTAVFKYEPYK